MDLVCGAHLPTVNSLLQHRFITLSPKRETIVNAENETHEPCPRTLSGMNIDYLRMTSVLSSDLTPTFRSPHAYIYELVDSMRNCLKNRKTLSSTPTLILHASWYSDKYVLSCFKYTRVARASIYKYIHILNVHTYLFTVYLNDYILEFINCKITTVAEMVNLSNHGTTLQYSGMDLCHVEKSMWLWWVKILHTVGVSYGKHPSETFTVFHSVLQKKSF